MHLQGAVGLFHSIVGDGAHGFLHAHTVGHSLLPWGTRRLRGESPLSETVSPIVTLYVPSERRGSPTQPRSAAA